jgi:hypothetical protein
VPARAQESTTDSPARAFLTAEVGTTRLVDRWVPLAGGQLLLRFASRFEVGGGGRIGLTRPIVAGVAPRVRLRFGYAGVTLGVLPAPARWPELRLDALIGSGNASATDPAVDQLYDSDNGLVIEPSASYGLRLADRVHAQGSASWRYARGFQVLGGIRSRDLRGLAATLGVTIGPF